MKIEQSEATTPFRGPDGVLIMTMDPGLQPLELLVEEASFCCSLSARRRSRPSNHLFTRLVVTPAPKPAPE